MNLGRVGACFRSEGLGAREVVDAARRLERFGYSALWLTDSLTRDPFVHAGWLLAATTELALATGIEERIRASVRPGPASRLGLEDAITP